VWLGDGESLTATRGRRLAKELSKVWIGVGLGSLYGLGALQRHILLDLIYVSYLDSESGSVPNKYSIIQK
jgi:hypothetical protein